ncbi:MAG: radical SAM protein, partial [Armatimonadota bacterium]
GDNPGPPVCILLLEITQACNLRCPTCYADAHGHDFMTLEEARRRLDAFFAAQSRLDVLMLSGGEPTIHPQFAEMLELALSYPIGRVLINTNGLRMAQSDALMATLSAHRSRIELYFSFGSFRAEVHERLYGRDLRVEKRAALERARDAGIFTTLVPTVERGVNDDEIGDLYRYALSMENINGVTYQPVMDNGRYTHGFDPADRLTLTGVLRELALQTNGELTPADFVGLPCSHPDCCVLTYGLLDAGRTVLTPLPRHLDVARYMDLFADRIA